MSGGCAWHEMYGDNVAPEPDHFRLAKKKKRVACMEFYQESTAVIWHSGLYRIEWELACRNTIPRVQDQWALPLLETGRQLIIVCPGTGLSACYWRSPGTDAWIHGNANANGSTAARIYLQHIWRLSETILAEFSFQLSGTPKILWIFANLAGIKEVSKLP